MTKKKEKETDESTHFSIRMRNDLLQRVDDLAEIETRTRSNAIGVLVKEALDAREK